MILALLQKSDKTVSFTYRYLCKPIKSKLIYTVARMCTPSHVNIFQEEEESFQIIEEWLMNYSGGRVNLERNCETGIATICLDRPEKMNAMSGQMMVQLCRAVDKLEKWPEGKGVIVRGNGRMLCSGGDLEFARATGSAKGGFRMATYMHDVLGRLKNLPLVSVAVVHGQGAIGGGAEIASSCDWRLMTEDCRGIGFVHSRMGIVPAWGATSRLVKLIGEKRALDAIVTGRVFTPSEALQIGLIDQIIKNITDTDLWIREKTRASAEVVQAAKLSVVGCKEIRESEKRALEFERRVFSPLWGGRANQEALNERLKHL